MVSDITDPELSEHLEVTKNIIDELGASDKPIIHVLNKCDGYELDPSYDDPDNTVRVSAKEGQGMGALLSLIEKTCQAGNKKCTLNIPYSDVGMISGMYDTYSVLSVEYADTGALVAVILDEKGRGVYKKHIILEEEV